MRFKSKMINALKEIFRRRIFWHTYIKTHCIRKRSWSPIRISEVEHGKFLVKRHVYITLQLIHIICSPQKLLLLCNSLIPENNFNSIRLPKIFTMQNLWFFCEYVFFSFTFLFTLKGLAFFAKKNFFLIFYNWMKWLEQI